MSDQAPTLRVIHFVTGGFSGATQVAIDLVAGAGPGMQPLLVLRRKRNTDAQRVDALRARGLAVRTVPGWSHAATVRSLVQLCREFRPQVLVAHGFSEHLWGRYAGLIAGVPALVHVEHNSRERYSAWRLAQARWLARRTAAIVGCSQGVERALLELGFPADRTMAIPNGIDLRRFAAADAQPWEARAPSIVMAARFARQKDPLTLLRALALLRDRGLAPQLLLAGGGKAAFRRDAEREVARLALQDQVRFLGHCPDIPGLLTGQRICALSTHYEGMPLSLVEGMAAGCAVVGSDVVGVRELIDPGRTGLLVPEGDAEGWADALARLLRDGAMAQRLAAAGRAQALREYGLPLMVQRYEALLRSLAPAATEVA